jgi:hypothetical protein
MRLTRPRAGAIDGDLAKLPEHDVSPAAAEKMAAAIRRRRDADSTTASPRSASYQETRTDRADRFKGDNIDFRAVVC